MNSIKPTYRHRTSTLCSVPSAESKLKIMLCILSVKFLSTTVKTEIYIVLKKRIKCPKNFHILDTAIHQFFMQKKDSGILLYISNISSVDSFPTT